MAARPVLDIEGLHVSKQQQNRSKPAEQQEQLPLVVPEPSPVDVPATPPAASPAAEQSQVQQEDASPTSEAASAGSPGKKRARKRGRLVNAEEVMPRPSYWPIALAFALIVLLLGIMLHPLVIA